MYTIVPMKPRPRPVLRTTKLHRPPDGRDVVIGVLAGGLLGAYVNFVFWMSYAISMR